MTDALAPAADRLPSLPAALRPSSPVAAALRTAALLVGIAALAGALASLVEGVAFLVIWTAAVVASVVVRRRRVAALTRRLEDASHMLQAGDVVPAIREFDELCRHGRSVPTYHALFVFYRGAAALEVGDVDLALAMLTAARDTGLFGRQRALGGFVAALHAKLAVAHALRDEPAAAAAALALAQAAVTAARRGSLLRDEVVVLARTGDPEGALRRIDADLEHGERHLPVARVRTIRALQAMCERRLRGPEYRTPAAADPREALADRVTREFLAAIAPRWPELREFLAAHAAN
jgi:hypothetical protein